MLQQNAEAIQGASQLCSSVMGLTMLPDLRAVLRLQPHNREALGELLSLMPLPSTPFANVGNHTPSSSSSKQGAKIESDSDILRRLGVQKQKPTKEPPFARTRADDRKIKILTLPGSEGFGTNKKVSTNASQEKPTRHGKEKASSARSLGAKEIDRMRLGCASYPGWERYLVKKVG